MFYIMGGMVLNKGFKLLNLDFEHNIKFDGEINRVFLRLNILVAC